MIKIVTVVGQSGKAYMVYDFPIITWQQHPAKGIYFLTKESREHYHEMVAIGESDNISQSLKSRNIVEQTHGLYILFENHQHVRNKILKDIENNVTSEKGKSISFMPMK